MWGMGVFTTRDPLAQLKRGESEKLTTWVSTELLVRLDEIARANTGGNRNEAVRYLLAAGVGLYDRDQK